MRPMVSKEGLYEAIAAYEKWVDTDIEAPFKARREATFIVSGKTMHCGPGCSKCCDLMVTICSPDALRLAKHLRDTGRDTPELRDRLRKEVQFAFQVAGNVKGKDEKELSANIATEYVKKGRACMFLEDGKCGVYSARPVVCRLFNSLEPAEKCMGDGKDQVLRLMTNDLREQAGQRGLQFSKMSWTPTTGILSEMVLWGLEELESVGRKP